MVLNEWQTGDPLDQIPLNNRSVRKGTESEIAAIPTAENEVGDYYFNTTEGLPQIQTKGGASDKRGNLVALLGADSTEVTVVGITLVQKKDIDYIKNSAGFKGNQLTIVCRLKTSNAGTTAHIVVEKNGGPTDELDLTTTSTSYVTLTGTIDISADADGVHTLEFFLSDGSGDTVSLKQLEVWGI